MIVYFLVRNSKRCNKQYVGSIINSFRKRFNFHKSGLIRYEKGKRGILGEYLYSHFFEEGHVGLNDVKVQIVDRIYIINPTGKKAFRAFKLD